MGVLVPRPVRPIGRAGAAGPAIFVASPRAFIAIIAAKAAFAAADSTGREELFGTAIVAGHRPIIPAALAVPVALAVAGAGQLAPPLGIIIAFAEAAAFVGAAGRVPVAPAALA